MQLPKVLPDELLFSRVVRCFEISGLVRSDFLEEVAGSKRASIHPLLPNGIERFSRFTSESSRQLLWEQTMAPLFLACLADRAEVIQDAMLGERAGTPGRSCQLPCFKYHPKLVLKFCPECTKEDIKRFGVSYWHRAHQVFGVNVCSTHHKELLETKLHGRSRLLRGLLPPTNCISATTTLENAQFAEFACSKLINFSSGRKSNTAAYRRMLKRFGYLTTSGRVRRQLLSAELYDLLSTLTAVDIQFKPTSRKDFRYVSGLLDKNNVKHPAIHLLFSYWISRTRKAPLPLKRPKIRESRPCLGKEKDAECLALLAEGFSLTEIMLRTGRSRCYLKRLAALNCIETKKQPTKLTSDRSVILLQLARKGFHRQIIAERLGISVGTVEMAISQAEGLVGHRKRCKYQSYRRRYKAQILRYRQRNPGALRKHIKKACSAAFFWLYLNERYWLEEALPTPTKAQAKPRVDWELRDKELAMKVGDVLSGCEGRISRSRLDRLLGGHGWLTKYRARLPRTMNVFRAHIGSCKGQS
ncbi:TnsD family Tn7-like transposition protein [Pseudovibrio japonicus]|uniref:TnsD family Tn7-like transposition protein n=1 Tax=Pseudovibrio japonicus TaxID=366534 RepID=UPI00167B0409|nr:TnsD family Tn7-like transposition protein [Pseudovibrio japonicus]